MVRIRSDQDRSGRFWTVVDGCETVWGRRAPESIESVPVLRFSPFYAFHRLDIPQNPPSRLCPNMLFPPPVAGGPGR